MTDDDYVAELRSHGMLSTNQAADRIEALTADHNATLARLADAVVREINLTAERDKWKTAFDETCDAWQKQCEHEMDKTKAAEAGRDRLETALVYAKDYLDLGMEKMAFNVIRHALRRRSHE